MIGSKPTLRDGRNHWVTWWQQSGSLVQGRPGNYLVYFPSYQYLNAVLAEFQVRHPSVPVLVQRPGMTESERDAFLAALPSSTAKPWSGLPCWVEFSAKGSTWLASV